jgi:hypothetical protein
MNRRRSLCSAPMLVAVGALFVALSGSATAAGSTGLILTGIAQPCVYDPPVSGTVSCYFTVDGDMLDDDSQGQTFIPAGTPNFTTLQLTTLARVLPGDYSAGPHDIARRCWTSAGNLYTSVASFTTLATADPAIAPPVIG